MTEAQAPRIHRPPIVVLGVQPNDPPFRLVEIAGELAGKAHSVLEVIEIARAVGLDDVDLDDPDVVRWVGGDKFTWTPFWPSRSGHSRHSRHSRHPPPPAPPERRG
ncbi:MULTISPECIES: hypothetical protein [Streptomyces]|uniref:Uncharacterized protein n=2 Tax=Streptomyces TaxID=1883 RepID=A0ABT9KN48_9ACTN|nr:MULTISPECIES: hypothetical protein [Streptomyces]MCO8308258.1 hypothetical protein [Streptomyces sp. RKCA744]MDP9609837.1 hypothetical protein [Streptomyces demainii]GHJ28088.1 hypothetical protein TPA0910_25210 [Streptomyces hygroscopicus]